MSIICAGFNDLRIFGDGWYGLEKSPEGVVYRATGPVSKLVLSSTKRIGLKMLVSARPEHSGEPLRVFVKGKQGIGFNFTLAANGWVLRQGSVIPDEDKLIHIETLNPWSPDRLYDNGDARSLGILLSAVRIISN